MGHTPARSPSEPVTPVQYAPPAGYALDVELYRDPELRRRGRGIEGRLERIDFHVLLFITAGRYRHTVDFEAIDCRAGSLIILRPGQVHRFDTLDRFRGWLVIFRAERLPPSQISADADAASQLDNLPTHLVVGQRGRRAIRQTFEQMADDAAAPRTSQLRNALLYSQLHSVIARLAVEAAAGATTPVQSSVLQRFRLYRRAVEREHHRWHQVRQYAKHLGCSAKSLNRAVQEVCGLSAKAFLADRVVLEAKRLLVHSHLPVAAVADALGFDEPTNFVKFFRRETGATPGAFQRRLRA